MEKKLDDDVCNLVTHFFQEDEYSRCPGMKDFVLVRIVGQNIKSVYCS